MGTGHLGITKTLHRLLFGQAVVRMSHVHQCKKGPTWRYHTPLQQHQVGASMEQVAVDILGCFLPTAREIATSSCLWTISQSGQRCKLSRTKVLPPLLNAWSAKCPAIAGLDYYYVLREWLREMHLQRLGLGYDTRCLGEDLAHGNGRYGSIVSPKSTSQWVQAVPCGV